MKCETCHGRGKQQHGVIDTPSDLVADYSADSSADRSFRVEWRDCEACDGTGQAKRIPVLQDGDRIGTLPAAFNPDHIKSTNWLYTPRRGDFTHGPNGEWLASGMLGPGDLEAVPGFIWDRK